MKEHSTHLPSFHNIGIPITSFLSIGGLSIIVLIGAYLFLPSDQEANRVSWIFYYAALFVNWPHFLASYVILYNEQGVRIKSQFRYQWAGIIVPLILIVWIVYTVVSQIPNLMGYMVNLMFFTVGWHYVKQTYGLAMAQAHLYNYKLTNIERETLKFTLYMVMIVNLIWSNQNSGTGYFFGIAYNFYEVSVYLLYSSYGIFTLLFSFLIYLVLKKSISEGKWPPLMFIAPIIAQMLWWIPLFYHKHFYMYMIPFFHSLQYLLFVVLIKKNRLKSESSITANPVNEGKGYVLGMSKYILLIFILGLLSFLWIPEMLDTMIHYDKSLFGNEYFKASFWLFINIHHYFIDNIIWRQDTGFMRFMEK